MEFSFCKNSSIRLICLVIMIITCLGISFAHATETEIKNIEPLYFYTFTDGVGDWNSYKNMEDQERWGSVSFDSENKAGVFPVNVWATRPGGFWGVENAWLDITLENENQDLYVLIHAKADDKAKRFTYDGTPYAFCVIDGAYRDGNFKTCTPELHNNEDYVDLIINVPCINEPGASLTHLKLFFPSLTSDGSGVMDVTGEENGYISVKYIAVFAESSDAENFDYEKYLSENPQPTEAPTEEPTKEPTSKPINTPKAESTQDKTNNTGDNKLDSNNTIVYVVIVGIAILAIVGLVVIILRKRKIKLQ